MLIIKIFSTGYYYHCNWDYYIIISLIFFPLSERAEIVNQSVTGLKEVKLDEKVKFTMDVTGIPLPSFQWYRGEDPIPESTSATHCINAFE